MDNQAQFKFACPHCGQHLAAEADMVGMELECPNCGKTITVPSAPATAEREAPKLRIVQPEDEATPKMEDVANQAKSLMKSAIKFTSGKATSVLHNLVVKWNALDIRHRKQIGVAAAVMAALLLLSCFTKVACSASHAKKSARVAIRNSNAALSSLASDLKADAAMRRKENEDTQRHIKEQYDRESCEREEEYRRRMDEDEASRARIAREESERSRREAERKREIEEQKMAEERRRTEAKLQADKAAESRKSEDERYAKAILEPLNLKPEDFGWYPIGWNTLLLSTESNYALAAKAALVQKSEGHWLGMALSLANLDNDSYRALGLASKANAVHDMRELVDFAALVVKRVQNSATTLEQCLAPDYCYLEPRIHVQKSINGKVSVSLKGKHYADCLKYQRGKDWLALLNSIALQKGHSKPPYEAYPPVTEGGMRGYLENVKFSLACKTDIDNSGNWDEPKLGFMIVKAPYEYPGGPDWSINYYRDFVDVKWEQFRERLPSDDGYMAQGWNLLISDVYILHTNYEKVFEPRVAEMRKRISQFGEKLKKEVTLGDKNEEEAKALLVTFAQDEAAAFAKLVESGTLEGDYRAKVKKEKEEVDEAMRNKLEAKAEKDIFSRDFGFKVYASKTLVAKGISVTMLGSNASIWKDIQEANAVKDWRRICEVMRTRADTWNGSRRESDDWDNQIMHARMALESFSPTFGITIGGEDVAKSCDVVFFSNRSDNDLLYHRDLDDCYEKTASGQKTGSYRIERSPFDGDFAIIHIDDIKDIAKEFWELRNNWEKLFRNSKGVLEAKRDAREITRDQYEVQLKVLRAKIKAEFVKKCHLSPLELKLAKSAQKEVAPKTKRDTNSKHDDAGFAGAWEDPEEF